MGKLASPFFSLLFKVGLLLDFRFNIIRPELFCFFSVDGIGRKPNNSNYIKSVLCSKLSVAYSLMSSTDSRKGRAHRVYPRPPP